MKTEIIKIDTSAPEWDKQLDYAAEVLRSGGLVAFPTETVYGLGANALDAGAAEKIYRAKGRPSDNPLIVHIADTKALGDVTGAVPQAAVPLIREFWPGPLTLIMPKSGKIPSIITAGLDTVAIRMPSHPVARALIKKAGIPVAAPSANSSGKPSPTMAKHVELDLSGKVDIIIDGGRSNVGVESTVLDVTVQPPQILRPGGVTREQLESLLGPISIDPAMAALSGSASPNPPRAPGMKYRHYAPKAPLTLIHGSRENVIAEITRRAENYIKTGASVGILATDETSRLYQTRLPGICCILSMGSGQKPESLAANLFKCLREFDGKPVDVILGETTGTDGIGLAVMNRLTKAAGGNIIDV